MKKIENFVAAFQNLADIYRYEEPYGNVELTGLVGLFEVCFEQSRNNVAHAYNKEVALDIIYDTKDKYYKMFERLEKVLRENWL